MIIHRYKNRNPLADAPVRLIVVSSLAYIHALYSFLLSCVHRDSRPHKYNLTGFWRCHDGIIYYSIL